MIDQLLQRGDVVAYAGRYFVVWKVARCDLQAFPIAFGAAAAFRPFMVPVGEELTCWDVTEENAAVAVGEHELLIRSSGLQAIRVGRCSGGLICRIVAAATRAYAARLCKRNDSLGSPGVRACSIMTQRTRLRSGEVIAPDR